MNLPPRDSRSLASQKPLVTDPRGPIRLRPAEGELAGFLKVAFTLPGGTKATISLSSLKDQRRS
jgi:hypothetical protein